MSTIGPHVTRRASDLLDARLSAAAELEVRTHLGNCAPCAAFVHREQQVRATLRAAAEQAPVPRGDLMAGLMALAAAPPQAVRAPTSAFASTPAPSSRPAAVGSRRVVGRSSVLAVAVLGSVSLASAGAIGVSAVGQAGLGALSPSAGPSSVLGPVRAPLAGTGSGGTGLASTASVVQPAVAVLRGAVRTASHTGIRWVHADAGSQP